MKSYVIVLLSTLALIVLLSLIESYILAYLWNTLLVPWIGAPEISMKIAYAIMIACNILFSYLRLLELVNSHFIIILWYLYYK